MFCKGLGVCRSAAVFGIPHFFPPSGAGGEQGAPWTRPFFEILADLRRLRFWLGGRHDPHLVPGCCRSHHRVKWAGSERDRSCLRHLGVRSSFGTGRTVVTGASEEIYIFEKDEPPVDTGTHRMLNCDNKVLIETCRNPIYHK